MFKVGDIVKCILEGAGVKLNKLYQIIPKDLYQNDKEYVTVRCLLSGETRTVYTKRFILEHNANSTLYKLPHKHTQQKRFELILSAKVKI